MLGVAVWPRRVAGHMGRVATVIDNLRDGWDRSRDDDTEEAVVGVLGRVGVGARGVLYLVVASLAVRIAFGAGGERPDRHGALATVAHQPAGRALVAVLAAGFLAYALWNLAHAILSPGDEDGILRRLRNFGRSLLYLGFFVAAARFVFDADRAARGDDGEQDVTIALMQRSGGRWVLLIFGLLVVGDGLKQAVKAARGGYRKNVEADAPAWIAPLAGVARFARAGVFTLIGVFVARVALKFDPSDAVGIDGSLLQLAKQDHGPFFLGLAAVAVALYGMYSLALVRWGRVVGSDSA